MSSETIIICSEDGKSWSRFLELSWPTYHDAMAELNKIDLLIRDSGKEATHYFELVGKEYFEKYKQPYC